MDYIEKLELTIELVYRAINFFVVCLAADFTIFSESTLYNVPNESPARIPIYIYYTIINNIQSNID